MNKKVKGISLIVLVITIIVMIIIAGAIILSLSNTNVIAKAKEGRAKNEISILKQQWQRAYSEALIDTGGIVPTPGEIGTRFGVSNLPVDYEITSTGLQYTGTDSVKTAAANALGVTVITLDTTAPIAGNLTNTVTPATISVTVAGASDVGSGIKNYAFYLNGSLSTTQTSNVYTYTSLTAYTNYTIKYVVRDNSDNTVTSSDTVIKTSLRIYI